MVTPPLTLNGQRPARKRFYAGTHRAIDPEKTIERVLRLAPVMGITRVANVTGLDTIGIPVVMVCRPNSRSIAVAQGKGLTLPAAKASGLMESVEGYHAERITLPLKFATYEELRYTHDVADVSKLAQPRSGIFHANLPLLWIEGDDLVRGERMWIPYETVHLNHTLPLPPGTGCFGTSSNGLACGNHLLEAISHGICEVVERDAAALWDLKGENEWQKTRIDLSSVNDPDCNEVLERFWRAHVCVAVWEITSDIGIPAFLSLTTEQTFNPLRPLPTSVGFGCHPARSIAMLRALTEAAQSRLTYISGSRDDLGRNAYEYSISEKSWQSDFARMEIRGPMREFLDVPSFDAETFNEDVTWELDRLRSAGIGNVLFVDLTKAELGMPVVRIVIPGLEPKHSIADYLPGQRAQVILERHA